MQGAIRGEHGSEVPCGGCTACCTASQFVHIEPDETDTLARIPAELLFPAPRLPRGHVVLGYDERGHCPMLIDDQCSIYEHRPRTCRTYDCRIFPAAGLDLDDNDQALITRQARRWRFDHPTPADRARHDACGRPRHFCTSTMTSSPTTPFRGTRHGSPCSRSKRTTRFCGATRRPTSGRSSIRTRTSFETPCRCHSSSHEQHLQQIESVLVAST